MIRHHNYNGALCKWRRWSIRIRAFDRVDDIDARARSIDDTSIDSAVRELKNHRRASIGGMS